MTSPAPCVQAFADLSKSSSQNRASSEREGLPPIPRDPSEAFNFLMKKFVESKKQWYATSAQVKRAQNPTNEKTAESPLDWPLDKAMCEACESAEDWERVEATFWMASAQFHQAEHVIVENGRKEKSLSAVHQMMAGMLDPHQYRALLREAGLDIRAPETIRGEAAQAALKTMLCAPGAPSSWGQRLPGKAYSAIDLLPEGPAKAALQKGVMGNWEGVSRPKAAGGSVGTDPAPTAASSVPTEPSQTPSSVAQAGEPKAGSTLRTESTLPTVSTDSAKKAPSRRL